MDKPYFLYDPEDGGITFYATEAERDAAAALAISMYGGDEWDNDVEDMCAGIVTHKPQQVNKVFRREEDESAHDPSQPVDWALVDYTCEYEMLPITDTEPPADSV